MASLSTAFIFLNQTNCTNDLHIECEGVVHNFFDRLRTEVGAGWAALVSVHHFGKQEFFLFHSDFLLWDLFVVSLFFLLFFGLFLFLLLASVTFNFLFESELHLYIVFLLKVARHWDLNDGWVVLQVKEQLVQVHINALRPRVKQNEVLLHFANAANGGLQHALNEDSLLGVHDLVVALLELAINVDVLDVKAGEVLENFVVGPRLDVLQQ